MSREIKFRAWNKDDKEMINDYCSMQIFEVWGFWSSEEFDYMQSTGLKDKNGIEIYEGDIVKHKGVKYIVMNGCYRDRCGNEFNGWFYKDGPTDWSKLPYYENEYLEIIGNIYQHLELLT